jgi:Cu(I)/Ag(I) efflux system membrane fusion protein
MAGMVQPSGPIIYYKDPNGRPFYSLTPRKDDDGKAYVAVLASEEVSVDPKSASQAQAGKKIIHYRNPMGLPDISLVPKKDSMGMDYIPVYEGDQEDGNTVKVSAGRLQRSGVKTELVGKQPISQTIRAPGVIAFDETRLSVVAMRFDGFVNKVMPVTSGTHVRKGDPLMSVFARICSTPACRSSSRRSRVGKGRRVKKPQHRSRVGTRAPARSVRAAVWRTSKFQLR